MIGGFSVVDVASREEALKWAARIAAACRCAQEVREVMPGPERLNQSAFRWAPVSGRSFSVATGFDVERPSGIHLT